MVKFTIEEIRALMDKQVGYYSERFSMVVRLSCSALLSLDSLLLLRYLCTCSLRTFCSMFDTGFVVLCSPTSGICRSLPMWITVSLFTVRRIWFRSWRALVKNGSDYLNG